MWRQVDIIWQPALTSSVVGPRRSSKALSKAKLAPKKGHGHCLVVCCPNDLLQLSESWRNHNMRSMLNKLMRCTENCNTCSHLWSTERAQFFSMAMPDHKTHNQHFKSWMTWSMKFCLIRHIHLASRPTTYHFFKHLDNFLHLKCFHNQQEAENAFQAIFKSWSMDFNATWIKKLISGWQKCVDFSYFNY